MRDLIARTNPERLWTIVAIAFFSIGLSLVLAAGFYITITRVSTKEKMPVSYIVPIVVIGDNVVPLGGELNLNVIRCNSSTKAVSLSTYSAQYAKKDGILPTKTVSVDLGGFVTVAGKSKDNPTGCEMLRLKRILPDTVTEGDWVYEGQSCIVNKPYLCTSWKTELWTVINN